MANCSIESFIEETNRANSAKDVSTIFGNALKDLGFDRFCYSLITAHPSLGLAAGHGIAQNYPDDWMAYYKANHYAKKDPVPRYGCTTSRPFTWESVVRTRKLKPDEKKVMNEAKEARLLDGVAIPICGLNGELAGIGAASSAGGIGPDGNLLSKIRTLAYHFHIAYTDFLNKDRSVPNTEMEAIHLTDREKEILLWAAEGKGDAVIAELIGVSYPTIRFHMNNIFKKLDASERTLATVKAIRLGLILPSLVR
ncbi:MAG: LuxR family transcriptional regulator [Rhodomicrobium sp.]